jgi:uncharacterized membrane protein YhaH (DUF805 family)
MNVTTDINPQLIQVLIPIMIVQLVLTVIGLVMLVKNWKHQQLPGLWLVLVLFLNLIGPILYFVIGRNQVKIGDDA